eukprot:6130673-Amphidinium_carterae.1
MSRIFLGAFLGLSDDRPQAHEALDHGKANRKARIGAGMGCTKPSLQRAPHERCFGDPVPDTRRVPELQNRVQLKNYARLPQEQP